MPNINLLLWKSYTKKTIFYLSLLRGKEVLRPSSSRCFSQIRKSLGSGAFEGRDFLGYFRIVGIIVRSISGHKDPQLVSILLD